MLKYNIIILLIYCTILIFMFVFIEDQGKLSMCTVFSASNYSGVGSNDGAYMQIISTESDGEEKATKVDGTNMSFNVFHYNISPDSSTPKSPEKAQDIRDLMQSKVIPLRRAFEAVDVEKDRTVTVDAWAAVMARVTKVKIRWATMAHILVPHEAIAGDIIVYEPFLDSLMKAKATKSKKAVSDEVCELFLFN